MCDPFTASVVIGVASTALSYQQQQQQAKYSEQLAIQQSQAANQSYINQTKQLALQEAQNDAAMTQQNQQDAIAAAKTRGTAIAAAGESGVSGLSVNALLADIYRQEATNMDARAQNNQMSRQQNDAERVGLQAQAQSRVNEALSNVTPGPSALGAALKIGGTVLNSGVKYKGWGTK